MQKRYIILAFLFLVIAAGLLNLPDMKSKNQIQATEFLNNIHSTHRYLTSDDLAHRIIDEDPMVFLVDVRSEAEFNAYHLPGAINIPFDQILDENWNAHLNQEIVDVIFYSNDDVYSEQAWALCKQQGFKNLFILEGGLNHWFETIMQPPTPLETDPIEAFELYSFRKGASIYFGSGSVVIPEEQPQPIEMKKTIPIQSKPKKAAEGGC